MLSNGPSKWTNMDKIHSKAFVSFSWHVNNANFPITPKEIHNLPPAGHTADQYLYIYTMVTPDPRGPGNYLGVGCGLADVRPRRDGCSLNGLACRDTCPADRFTVASASGFSFLTQFRKSSLLLFLATHTSLLSRESAHKNIYIYITYTEPRHKAWMCTNLGPLEATLDLLTNLGVDHCCHKGNKNNQTEDGQVGRSDLLVRFPIRHGNLLRDIPQPHIYIYIN